MSIFDVSTTQTTPKTFTAEDAHALYEAFMDTMDALNEAQEALEQAQKAAQNAGAYVSFRLERANERDVVAAFWKTMIRTHPAYAVMSSRQQDHEISWVGSDAYHRMGRYPRNFPEFTPPNILDKARELEERQPFFLREWALTLYQHLIAWPEKAHEIRIPAQIRVRGAVDSSHRVSYGRMMDDLSDLDRLFHYLDGQILDTENPYTSPLVIAIAEAKETRSGETPYFRFKTYRNGNLQLTFKNRGLAAAWEALAREGFISRMNNR